MRHTRAALRRHLSIVTILVWAVLIAGAVVADHVFRSSILPPVSSESHQ